LNTYALHITPYDPAFFAMIFIALTFSLLLWFTKKPNPGANRFLALALVIIVLWIARILGIDIGLSAFFPNWSRLPLQFSLALGPLIYFYVLKITWAEYKFRFKDLLHFCPLLLELGAQVLGFRGVIKTGSATYGTQIFQWLTPLLHLLAFISAGIYLYHSHKLIRRFYNQLKFNGGDRHLHQLRWLHNLLKGFALLWLLWILFTAADYFYFDYQLSTHAYYPLYLALAAITTWMAVAAHLRAEAGVTVEVPSFLKPQLPAELKQKGIWLKKIVKSNLYYQDPELSLVALAEKLELTTHELSRIINTVLKKSFNDFINEYRVQDAIQKMHDPAYDHITLLGIAYDSGFNSQSTFYRTFKQVTGKSPVEYKTELKKQYSSYNLGSPRQFAAVISNYETTPKWPLKKLNRNFMFRNYLKIALRNLLKQKTLAFINVSGLSIGIACVTLLSLFVINEFNFDKFHENAVNIYRPYVLDNTLNGQPGEGVTDFWVGKTTMGEAMKRDLPDIQNFVRIQLPWGENLVRTDKNVERASLTFADNSLFSVFTFPLKYGNISTALHGLNDIVLTETRAKQLFGRDDAVGKIIEIQIGTAFQPFMVSAVAKDLPANSTIRFDILGNFLFAQKNSLIVGNNWHPTVWQTYVQLRPGSTLPGDKRQLARFYKGLNPNYEADLKNSGLTWEKNQQPFIFKLQPLLSIHTDSWFHGWSFTDYEVIDPKTIWLLLAIAAGILLIACINFTTLAIGRSAGRSKEVGVRKVIGAGKRQIIIQFLTEALLLTIVSAALGMLLTYIFLPWFNQLSGRELQFSISLYPQIGLLLAGLVLVVGLLAGSYPALVLSNFKPVEVLKNKIRVGGSNLFTKSLVTFQFVLSITLIIATTTILQQTKYLINKNPGFNKENVVAIDASQVDPNKNFPLFKQAVLAYPEIVGVTSAMAGLGAGNDLLGYSDPGGSGISAAINVVDPDYIKVLGMRLLVGRNFDPMAATDTIKRVIINETMMRAFKWTAQNAVGQTIKNFQGRTAYVIGVVKNFNYRPLSEGVKNQVFETSADKGYIHFYVRINPGNPSPALRVIQKAWNSVTPGIPIKYTFLDDDVNNYYNSEQKWTSMVGWASGLSIFLACLGLLGLAALAAINRTKEIGVRKILGASVLNITGLLLRDFVKLISIAFLIASPIAWYFMSKWLQGYANRISIGWPVFLLAGVFTFGIAVLVIGFQAMKAAVARPVKSLRTE